MSNMDDISLERVSGKLLEAELGHVLGLKGFCVLDSGLDEDALETAADDAGTMHRAGRFQLPPEQVVDGILGPEGTRELCWLDDDVASQQPQLAAVVALQASLAGACLPFCSWLGEQVDCTRPLLVKGGEVTEDAVDITEEDCMEWLTTLSQAKLMVICFLGANEGTLELEPLDGEAGVVELTTRRGMVVVLRADKLLHRHVSSPDDYSLCCWIKAITSVGPRGWQDMDPTILDAVPAVKELNQWMQGRLQEIADLEMEDKLDGKVSREWRRWAHHTFFRKDKNPVAVRGDSLHGPGAWDPAVFWTSLNVGVDYQTEVPIMRWDHSEYYDPTPDSWLQSTLYRPPTNVRTNVRHGQFIEGCDLFDTKFFGISVMEAKGMDPMQKHVLETSYEALFAAGYKKKDLMNSYIAVFTGCAHSEWNYIDKEAGACSGTGSSQAIVSNRTSFALGMMGPSSSIDCEMSSASVALMVGAAAVSTTNDRRVESGGNSSAAIVGGVFLTFTPFMWPRYNAWMNPNGRCFSFDDAANGYVRGEMCGSVALKPYAEKVDKDLVVPDQPCIGCINGWRMVSNGKGASLNAPHGPAIQECVHDAIRDASIDVLDVDAVECHGIGGALEDSVEGTSIAAALRGGKSGESEALVLGAVKTHVGAQCEACGMAQLLKILYNIGFASQCPSNHLRSLNPHIDFGGGAVMINTEAVAYKGRSAFHSFSSRGLGGTTVHGVVWYRANEKLVQMPGPELERQSFTFWPGGGGVLELGQRPSSGRYGILGSWASEREAEEMSRCEDGSYSFIVTLGVNRFECFQICVDGDESRILHPMRPFDASGTSAEGPSAPEEVEGLRWRIDGRGVSESTAPYVGRDEGQIGDKYEVKLWVAGKYRAVTWRKLQALSAEPSAAGVQDLSPALAGRYFLAGAWTGWEFEEMTETGPGVYSLETCLGFGATDFVVARNRDWDQVFCPSSLTAAKAASPTEVIGPTDLSLGLAWKLKGKAGEWFKVEFQRTFEDNQDLKRISWRKVDFSAG
mmetsp:Transcript_5636/g.13238  ORF Transcript_5636/g.13238 Transcript_5636/m.13238 type:complete len:1020 (+) Transcript_5636:99-3158(+)|eukprot:CAMPEP_0206439338 /NCGR_PEP_ID=MMETSP0324_2-20121206/12150_1 /ASSEMBLY_ACC=CAM_ASM_000836 /TAXON_ID=2866 /ORGANISM="Crypthecodinium cohnii, Strain Seligo" /LENGTH=1019 /DNA_ID=CAMNT_0053906937 /DNA_START=18 /DNA_END=3077 /DNA_ORIENTATION=-